MSKKIYVASSWRNPFQRYVVDAAGLYGYEVYDFKNPPGRTGFSWSQIDDNWRAWSTQGWRIALEDGVAIAGCESDFNAMREADVCLMVMPCGRSAHTEAGWMKGAGKKVWVIFDDDHEAVEPELMYKIFNGMAVGRRELNHLLLSDFTHI
jgi:hypothetical protein